MIVALRGSLVRWEPELSVLWLEVSGVTYEVLLPRYAHAWVEACDPALPVHLYTIQHATDRQPVPVLIGFPRLDDRRFFQKFIEVPDVGPAKAVRAMTFSVPEIARWIEAGDTRALKQLPGIGDRLAQTIVARLNGRVSEEALLDDGSGAAPAASGLLATAGSRAGLRDDAVEALVALQFGQREADQVVRRVLLARPDMDSLEEVLREVLTGHGSTP